MNSIIVNISGYIIYLPSLIALFVIISHSKKKFNWEIPIFLLFISLSALSQSIQLLLNHTVRNSLIIFNVFFALEIIFITIIIFKNKINHYPIIIISVTIYTISYFNHTLMPIVLTIHGIYIISISTYFGIGNYYADKKSLSSKSYRLYMIFGFICAGIGPIYLTTFGMSHDSLLLYSFINTFRYILYSISLVLILRFE